VNAAPGGGRASARQARRKSLTCAAEKRMAPGRCRCGGRECGPPPRGCRPWSGRLAGAPPRPWGGRPDHERPRRRRPGELERPPPRHRGCRKGKTPRWGAGGSKGRRLTGVPRSLRRGTSWHQGPPWRADRRKPRPRSAPRFPRRTAQPGPASVRRPRGAGHRGPGCCETRCRGCGPARTCKGRAAPRRSLWIAS
jgi:hypothetical protein